MRIHSLLLIAPVLVLSGCTPLRKAVNHRFPPINENQQRQAAVESTAKALSAVKAPTILAEINLTDAGQVLLTDDLRRLGVTKLKLEGAQQLLRITLDFHHKFSESDAGESVEGRKFIGTWRPEVSGSVVLFAGVRNPDLQAINLADIPAMDLQILPALSTIRVDDVKIFGHYRATLLVQPLVMLLNMFKDNVSGILAKTKFASISIPEIAKKPIDLDKAFSFQVAQQKLTATISENPIPIPNKLTGVAWRISDDNLTVLLQVLPQSAIDLPARPVQPATFKEIDDRFNDLLKANFGLSSFGDSELVAVNEDLVANTLAGAVEQAAPCVAIAAPQINIAPVDKMISVPPDSANCLQDPTNCIIHCQHNHADDHCGTFAVPCKVAEAAKNAAFDAEYATCIGARDAKIAACRAGQTATQAGCEAAKTTFNAAVAGEVGDVTARVSANASAEVCVSRLTISDHLTSVSVDVSASGKASGNLALGFSPRRGLGRAICYMNLGLNNGFTADFSAPRWSASSPSTVEQAGEDVYVSYDLQGGRIAVSYSPSLASLLLRDFPGIAVKCPVPVAVAGAGSIAVAVPEVLALVPNEFQLPVPPIKGVQVIPLPKVSIGEEKFKITLRPVTDKAIIIEGRLEK